MDGGTGEQLPLKAPAVLFEMEILLRTNTRKELALVAPAPGRISNGKQGNHDPGYTPCRVALLRASTPECRNVFLAGRDWTAHGMCGDSRATANPKEYG
jgi:hypothetical protein